MIVIVDYGVGNLFSLKSSLNAVGADVIVSGDPEIIKSAEKIILPGVGAFEDAARKLRECGLDELICSEAANGKPLLGICLGMQLLFDRSFEYGEHRGLGLIPGDIIPMSGTIPESLKIPHIGWNSLTFAEDKCEIFKYLNDGEYVYFVHSYYAPVSSDYTAASTEYGIPITAAAVNGNVYGCQFHPEKSGETGLKILKAFCEL